MEKCYQMFVSSASQYLQEERQNVMHALLELDYISSSMELFSAANETQRELIRRVINGCDILGQSKNTNQSFYSDQKYPALRRMLTR
jgi:hypothetical protein